MAQCMSPFQVRDKENGTTFPVPCGKCAHCIARRTSQWSHRLVQEDKDSLCSWFVTLTYNNEHVPRTPNGFKTVCKKDVQKFMKRLRHYAPKFPKIKYYAAAEYGSKTQRPHYHIILFNVDPDDVERAWRDKDGNPLGSCYFGTVTAASVGYSLKYISKKGSIPLHQRDDRTPEFSLQSTKLGIGYLTPAMVQYHEHDMLNRMYVNIENGKKIAMCRYYKDKLYTKEQREHIGSHLASKMAIELEKKIKEYGPNYYRDKAEADHAANERRKYKSNKTDTI